MAEVMFKQLIKEEVENEQIFKNEFKVLSAGTFAVDGDEANGMAVEVLEMAGFEAVEHKANPLDEELLEESYLILTMTEEHKISIITACPDSEYKTFTLNEFVYGADTENYDMDIMDPYRGDLEDYTECAKSIKSALDLLLIKLINTNSD